MYDFDLAVEILREILGATQKIEKRFRDINSADDFLASDRGEEKLDSICMQLIAIGEVVKKLDRITEGKLLVRYPGIQWKRVMGMRDILSHHYFDMDVEVVYAVCSEHIAPLATEVSRILKDLESSSPKPST